MPPIGVIEVAELESIALGYLQFRVKYVQLYAIELDRELLTLNR